MKKLIFILCLLLTHALQAQMLLKGKINHAKPGQKVNVNVPYDVWYHKQNSQEVALNTKGEFTVVLPIKKPQTIFLDFDGTRLYLYAEPSKTLTIQADAKDFINSLKFKGKLVPENAFWYKTGLTMQKLYPQNWNDTLTYPSEILASIKASQATALQTLKNAKLRNKNFIRITAADISYFASSKLFDLIYKNNVWSVGHVSKHSRQEWLEALKTAYSNQPLSNVSAIGSFHYGQTIAYYPRFLEMSCQSKEEFMKLCEEIFGKPFAEINKEVRAKGENYWQYKALNYGLEGHALENALASLITNGLESGEIAYLPEAYEDFLKRFPNSSHKAHLIEAMKPLLQSKTATVTTEIILEENSSNFKLLEEILAQHKGKAVYIDMWGSWCGPCREEFKYTAALKEKFKDKPVDFVYIAFEHSSEPEKTWKDMITFYMLEGRHILGSKELEEYFRNLYASKGTLSFPSYLLIDKNGEIVNLQAERPSAGEKLYNQIEQLLR